MDFGLQECFQGSRTAKQCIGGNILDKESVNSSAFLMISYAGDAFDLFYQGMYLYRKNRNIDEVLKLYREGEEKLNQCHKVQSQLLSKEADEQEIPYSIIMTHAQDHLLMATNWQRLLQLEIIDLV